MGGCTYVVKENGKECVIAAPDLQQKTQLLLVDNLATVTLRVSKAVNFFVFLIVICFCFSVAHSLGSEELNYGTDATETVPDCRGNETSLSLCPAQPSPPNCAAHCARVDCNVNIIPTPSCASSFYFHHRDT